MNDERDEALFGKFGAKDAELYESPDDIVRAINMIILPVMSDPGDWLRAAAIRGGLATLVRNAKREGAHGAWRQLVSAAIEQQGGGERCRMCGTGSLWVVGYLRHEPGCLVMEAQKALAEGELHERTSEPEGVSTPDG